MPPQMPAGFAADTPKPSGFVPDGFEPDFATTNQKDESGNATILGGISSMWERGNRPLIPQIGQAAHAIADYFDQPNTHRSKLEAQLRGFSAGSLGAAGDLAAGFTSPIGAALTLATMNPDAALLSKAPALQSLLKLPAVQTLRKAVQVAAGAGFTTHGASRVVTEPTLAGKLAGGAEMASGLVGAVTPFRSTGPDGAPIPRLNAQEQASNAFARANDVPLDLATATGSKFYRAAQKRVANSMGGEGTADRLIGQQQQALGRVGNELAGQANPTPVTPEGAGSNLQRTIAGNVEAHTKTANEAYDRLRAFEEDPAYRMHMPNTTKAPVDEVHPDVVGELRRIVHEMDASGFVKRNFNEIETKHGGDVEVSGGGGGAKVYHDILSNMSEGSNPPRGSVQREIEAYLGGEGKETAAVRAAIGVAEERSMLNSGKRVTVSTPELPPNTRSQLTYGEKRRLAGQEMGLPVDTTAAKAALKPVYEQMMRQMPVTQQQANPGLKAIGNILEGPDYAPLSQVDQDLSAIKALARERGGLAKLAVQKLEADVMQAAKYGGPDVVNALNEGRQATIAKYQASNVLEQLRDEPVQTFRKLTAPKDSGINALRQVQQQAPSQMPDIARAYLEDVLGQATERGRFDHADRLYANWQKLGGATKQALFPNPGQVQALDQFFLLAKRVAENPNPSGTAHTWAALNVGSQPLTWALSKILYSPKGVSALTRLMALDLMQKPSGAVLSTAARTAALTEIASTARSLGVPMGMPRAAENQPDTGSR